MTGQVSTSEAAQAGEPGWSVLDGEPLLRIVATAIVLLSRRQAPGDPVYEDGVQRAYNQLVLRCLRVVGEVPHHLAVFPLVRQVCRFVTARVTRHSQNGCLVLQVQQVRPRRAVWCERQHRAKSDVRHAAQEALDDVRGRAILFGSAHECCIARDVLVHSVRALCASGKASECLGFRTMAPCINAYLLFEVIPRGLGWLRCNMRKPPL